MPHAVDFVRLGVVIPTILSVLALFPPKGGKIVRLALAAVALLAWFQFALDAAEKRQAAADSIVEKHDVAKAQDELKSQIQQLIAGSTTQATTEDVRALRGEFRDGVKEIVAAIKQISSPPAATATAPVPTPTPAGIPPPVRHIRYTERPISSEVQELPYGLQVILQTDITVQPTQIVLTFDKPVGKRDFFLAGQSTLIGVMEGEANGGRTAVFSFQSPPWTPANAVVVSVFSKEPTHVVDIKTVPLP